MHLSSEVWALRWPSAAFAFAAAVPPENSSCLSVAAIVIDTSFSIGRAEIAAGQVSSVVLLRTFVVAASAAGAFVASERSIACLAVEVVQFFLASPRRVVYILGQSLLLA